jgi:CDP-diacylglycerol--serine O-phosphatidyltransferase
MMRSPVTSIHPSNLLTYASLTSGVGALAAALNGSSRGAGVCLAIAALADTFDGRFARRFRRSRDLEAIGLQLDSLVDAVSFGLVPVATTSVLLSISGHPGSVVWWMGAAFYTVCALTRLAFYNVVNAGTDTRAFIGLPTPVAALIWSTMMLMPLSTVVATGTAVATAIAMVAPLHIARPTGARLIAFALWPVVLVLAHGCSVRL